MFLASAMLKNLWMLVLVMCYGTKSTVSGSVSDFRNESPTSDADSLSKTSEEIMEEW